MLECRGDFLRKRMIHHLRNGAVLITLAFAASGVSALGFGAIPGSAVLGMPLDLRVPLRLEAGEDVNSDCVSAQVQFGDSLQTPGTVVVRLEPAAAGMAERVIRIQTTIRVNEPVVTVDLSAGCASRVSRTLTLFADPPLVAAPVLAESQPAEAARGAAQAAGVQAGASAPAQSSQPAPPTLPIPQAPQASQGGPSPDAAQAPRKAPPAKPPGPRRERAVAEVTAPSPSGAPSGPSAAAPPSASASAPARRSTPLAKPLAPAASAVAAAATPRLRLSTLEEGASARPSAVLAAAEAASAASAAEAAASAMMAASAAEAAAAARAAELEAASQKLRAEVERTQRQINELNAKLREVESGSRGEPLIVYLLGGLVLLLSGGLWFMWRQREQDRRSGSWLDQPAAGSGTDTLLKGSSGRSPLGPASQPLPLTADERPSGRGSFNEDVTDSRSGAASDFDSVFAPLGRPRRAVSVEELIDLEQQAEFFIVLGQDEAAIELLTSHLGSSSDSSPLPYLKLLEIFKRRGERSDYERLRERFNRHFAGNAPDWETDLQGGRSLVDYPDTLNRLKRLWSSPKQAMEMLQASLLRDRAEESQAAAAREAFDLPAYRELMLLYSIARDLAETVADGGTADIPLNLDASLPEPAGDSAFDRLMATMPVEPQPQATQSLSIDLSLDDIEAWPSVAAPAVKKPGAGPGS